MKIDQQINELFTKYLDGKCSPDEWEELLILIDGVDEADTEALIPPLLLLWEKAGREELSSRAHLIDKEKMYAIITRDEDAQQETGAIPIIPHKKWFSRGQRVAAVFIGLFLLSGVLYFVNKSQRSVTVKKDMLITADLIPPGSSKAILTLANGQQIVLDSAKGTIGRQGASVIINKGDGQLSYEADKGSPPTNDHLFNTISTSRANQYQVVLADGSKVWLNALSSLRYPSDFSGSDRSVEMTGEAYFEITKDPSRPFHVKVNGTDIEVLGTQFNVNAYTDEAMLKTSLVDGAVKVSVPGRTTLLSPGQESILLPGGNLTVGPGDVGLASAWKNGFFQFDKAPLPAVMRQIGRWYDLDIEYASPVPDRLFKGKLQRSLPLSGILRLLQKGGVHFTVEGRVLKVTE